MMENESTGYTVQQGPVVISENPDDQAIITDTKSDLKDSNLYKYAVHELDLLGLVEEGEDDPNTWMRRHLLKMVAMFADEGHSGASAAYALSCLQRLLAYEPLTPLTYADDEWIKHEPGVWQNRRNSAVFTDDDAKTWYNINEPNGPDGKAVRHPI